MTSPDHLSPAPASSPEPAALPFGLTWADLADVLPGGAAGGRAVVSHLKRGRHQGGHPSVIMTLSWESPSGPRRTTLFFKSNPGDSREASRYRFLTDHRIAVPRLEVCVERAGREVLGLQFLPSIGTGPADVDDVLGLVARLNALTDVPDAVGATPAGLPQAQFERLLLPALDEISSSHPDLGATTWLDTYRRALVAYRALPTALTHGELAPQQLGRTEEGTLVMLDLATVGRRPRFTDLANLLATLAQLAGTDEQTVLGHYLAHLARESRAAAPVLEQAGAELQLTRFVRGVEALPWRLSLGRPDELGQQLRIIVSDHRAVRAQLDR